MSVTPRGMSVQEAYREFRSGNFRVNRRYQRKLVWTLAEKRSLVDSVLLGYPIPLILLTYRTLDDGTKQFEILDGMQRLDALFSFIENRYDFNGRYFDVNQLSRAKQLAEQGEFSSVTDEDRLLSPEQCANYLDYTFAVTEFPGTSQEDINEIFGRINSYGRQLSAQERRQAGVVTSFATLVRELAAEIRGDVSSESLDLAHMPSVSIDVSGEAPSYGVKADETFWCKQGILRRNQLRDSEDEQIIADLAITILEKEPFAFSGNSLDQYYTPNSDESRRIENLVSSYGTTSVKHEIQSTISILRDVIEATDSAPNALRRTVMHPKSGGSNPIKTAFYAIFNAFFDFCVRQEKSPERPQDILESIKGLNERLYTKGGRIKSNRR